MFCCSSEMLQTIKILNCDQTRSSSVLPTKYLLSNWDFKNDKDILTGMRLVFKVFFPITFLLFKQDVANDKDILTGIRLVFQVSFPLIFLLFNSDIAN